jgi:hypothetical protein
MYGIIKALPDYTPNLAKLGPKRIERLKIEDGK